MDNSPINEQNFFRVACYFEGSLLIIAFVIGWFVDINPFANLYFSEMAVFYGIVGTIPMFIFFMALYQIQINSFQEVKRALLDTLAPNMVRLHWTDLFILAAIAGFTEEVLFRGTIQPWLESSWGMNTGLIASNVIFGLVHAVTPMYAVLAALVGIFLGLSMDYGGDRNLLTPIIIHGLYDFLAFLVIVQTYRRELAEKKQQHNREKE
jgi:membrane protease YdiL (CAAX protease family)